MARRGQHSVAQACLLLSLGLLTTDARAVEVNLIGLFPGKAVISIDGGAPRTLSLGSAVGPVKLIETGQDRATFEIEGKRITLPMGQFHAGSSSAGRKSTVLTADGRGHFVAPGSINGASLSFLVDTGASLVVMSSSDATRLGINWRAGRRSLASTANGQVVFYRVVLPALKVGDIVLNNVDAGVQESGLPNGVGLLGMSFLNRTEIQQSGQTMVLTQRY